MGKTLLATLVTALGLGLAGPASAAGPPPSIDDLDGATFSVRAAGAAYDLAGGKSRFDNEITWTITKTGATTVSLDSVFGGMDFSANYVNGFLLQSTNSGGSPAEWGSSLFLVFTGQPGKLKFKGGLTVVDAPPGYQVLRILKVSGKES